MSKEKDSYPTFSFTAVDVETTGLNPIADDIIEIAAVKFKNSRFVDTFQSFINIGKPIPSYIKTLTNISDDNLLNAPSQKVVLDDFLSFIGDDILCFHNARFDYNFINSALEKSALPMLINDFYDTLEIARIFTPHLKSHSLSKLCEHFQITNRNIHRAEGDAKATGELLLKLTEFICGNFEIGIINQINEIANLANLSSQLPMYLSILRSYMIKTSLQRERRKSQKFVFFPKTNFVSNLKKNEGKSGKFSEDEILNIFENGGQLAEKFENYEFRQGQIDMAAWVTEAYKDGKILLIEAGTGVGKSLAYLIPSIFFSKFAQKRVIISTNTKNLQEQLFYKDIPSIQKVTNLTFAAALLKGRRNYICLRKWNEVISDITGHLSPFERKLFLNLIVWAANTKTGDIEENRSFHTSGNSLWQKIAADSRFCYGRKCNFYDQCFVMRIRYQAEKSNLIIINHYLLLSDAVNENSVLGNYSNLVIDEAHNLPQTAAIHFGFSITLYDLLNISRKILTKGEFQYGIVNNIKIAVVKSTLPETKKSLIKNELEEILEPLEDFENVSTKFFHNINQTVIEDGNYGKLRFQNLSIFNQSKNLVEAINNYLSRLFKQLQNVYNELSNISPNIFPFYDQNISDLEGIKNQIEELQLKFQNVFSPDFENFAFWLETTDKEFNAKHYPHCAIVCAPIEVNQYLHDYFWSKLETVVLTSATIAIRDEYKFYKKLTGLDMVKENKLMEFIASSPFNYPKQMKILIPDFLPDPRDKFFSSQAISLIKEIISAHNRGTLVLFTAYKDLDATFSALTESTSEHGITLLAQGKTGSRTSILDVFREEEDSVLLGTRSFWEGIDVQGKSLEILIMYRLPFLVPTEPLVEAYMDKLRKEGKNSFLYYLLPISLLHFKQGFGRLIRNKTDIGVVVILDSRIFKKDYGKYFIKVMPVTPVKVSSNLGMTDYITGWFDKK